MKYFLVFENDQVTNPYDKDTYDSAEYRECYDGSDNNNDPHPPLAQYPGYFVLVLRYRWKVGRSVT